MNWFFHHWPVIFLIALVFFLLAFFLGWILWRGRKAEVARIEAENDKLRREHEQLDEERTALERRLA